MIVVYREKVAREIINIIKQQDYFVGPTEIIKLIEEYIKQVDHTEIDIDNGPDDDTTTIKRNYFL